MQPLVSPQLPPPTYTREPYHGLSAEVAAVLLNWERRGETQQLPHNDGHGDHDGDGQHGSHGNGRRGHGPYDVRGLVHQVLILAEGFFSLLIFKQTRLVS